MYSRIFFPLSVFLDHNHHHAPPTAGPGKKRESRPAADQKPTKAPNDELISKGGRDLFSQASEERGDEHLGAKKTFCLSMCEEKKRREERERRGEARIECLLLRGDCRKTLLGKKGEREEGEEEDNGGK